MRNVEQKENENENSGHEDDMLQVGVIDIMLAHCRVVSELKEEHPEWLELVRDKFIPATYYDDYETIDELMFNDGYEELEELLLNDDYETLEEWLFIVKKKELIKEIAEKQN